MSNSREYKEYNKEYNTFSPSYAPTNNVKVPPSNPRATSYVKKQQKQKNKERSGYLQGSGYAKQKSKGSNHWYKSQSLPSNKSKNNSKNSSSTSYKKSF